MTIETIIQQREYFQKITWKHLSNCLKSFEEKEYLSVAIWAAVFVESILKDYLKEFGEKGKERDELEPLIRRTANYINNTVELSDTDKYCVNDILRRAEEIRSKRNRLVHDTGVENRGLRSDVNDMYNNIKQIITSYLETSVSQKIYQSNMQFKDIPQPKNEKTGLPVFISTITPHTFEQIEFIEGFCTRLKEIGIEPIRCKLTDFDKRDPMNKVRQVIGSCKAFIAIGLERSHAYYFRDKEGSENQQESTHRRYTSAWLQLESGMAIALGKEVFVLCQKDLFGDGIFDRDWNSFVPLELALPLNIYDNSVEMLLNKLKMLVEDFEEEKM